MRGDVVIYLLRSEGVSAHINEVYNPPTGVLSKEKDYVQYLGAS